MESSVGAWENGEQRAGPQAVGSERADFPREVL